MNLFTPRLSGTDQRLSMTLSDPDYKKIRRGRRWSATVTDVRTGKKYRARGASCGSPSCFCDAIVKEVK